jgi:curved DNA-binding protein CbpA
MADKPFVDYYEILQVGQNADLETIERVFRLLAKRYHPDNLESGDDERFREVHDAFEVLADPELRAEYDVQYDRNKTLQWSIFEQGSAIGGQEEDRRIFRGVLALLYAARRKNPRSGGLGAVDLERMLGVPREHLEFPNWYLKKKGWVEVLDSGQFAITVEGIDKVSSDDLSVPDNRLLSEPAEETPLDSSEETLE